MKRTIEEEQPAKKKQEVEAPKKDTPATESTPSSPRARPDSPSSNPKASPKASPEASRKSSPEPSAAEKPIEQAKPAKPNPLFSGAFGSSFGGFGAASKFGAPATSSANPWAEPKASDKNPFSEPKADSKDPETQEATPEQEEKHDKFAVVSLEKKQLKTGEEGEHILFKARSKLYCLNLKNTLEGWKERGVGTLHLNIDEAKGKNRVLMRADTLLKVILNITLSKGTEVHKGFQSSAHAAKFVRITTTENGELVQFAFRLQTPDIADEFYNHLEDLLKN